MMKPMHRQFTRWAGKITDS